MTRCTARTRSSSSAASITVSARTSGCWRSSRAVRTSGGDTNDSPSASTSTSAPALPRLRIVNLHNYLAGPFDLDLAAGECLAITGASGAGKSLFLRMVADLDPSQGEVFLDGAARRTLTAPAWRRKVVYSAAEPGWWHERVADHFPGDAMDAARGIAPRLALASALLQAPVVQLSTGERQRVALIRVLALQSPVLLLDEPTGALDEASTALVEDLLRERLAAGVTIAMITHSAAQAERLGHRHLRMDNRRLAPA